MLTIWQHRENPHVLYVPEDRYKPVYVVDDGGDENWYFYDECYQEHGPFDTKEIAKAKLDHYCIWLNTGV